MRCCYSCKYWNKASRKIPIDARKVIKKEEKIEIVFKNKVIEIPSWTWVPKSPIKMKVISCMRFCFYGKGLIRAWDECENYEPRYHEDKALCELGGNCAFKDICPKFKRYLSYIV